MSTNNVKLEPFLLSRKEASLYLGIGLNTLTLQNIPKVKIRRRVLYRRDVLEKWAIDNTIYKEENHNEFN